MNIFVSEAQKTDFEKRFHIKKWRLKVVHNGIAFEKFDMLSYTSVRDEFAIPGNNLVFICVGNFTSGRDQMTICRFLKILKMNEPGFRLIFAGTQSDSEPHLYDECVTYCKDNDLNENVIFAGLRDDVPSLLKQCDAFIYATNHDTFGIAVIEAIAAGIPVLVNDWEVMLEITENGRRAILYRTKDETDLLDKFLGYLAKKSWFNEQAKENAAWARKQYSIQHHMSDLYKVYNHLQ